MTTRLAGVLGSGYRLPHRVRRNDDPVFAGLDRSRNAQGIYQSAMFRGLDRRHVLGPQESVTDLVTQSCAQALDRAGLAATDIDRLYGYVTVPEYLTPNPLYQVHHDLGLPEQAMVVPINSEFTNFIAGLALAAEAVTGGAARHCLVTCGSNWTRHVDYTQGHSSCIGDAAGAVVVGASDRFVVVEHATRTHTAYLHSVSLRVRQLTVHGRPHLPVEPGTGIPVPTLEINQTGVEMLGSVIKDGVPLLVDELLARNQLTGDQISLITHQGVRPFLDHWDERVRPKRYVDTLAEFGNMLTATYPVNLAHAIDQHAIDTEYVVICGVGAGVHISAVLLRV
jgi:3-oxoacyl-[acyl-carrier-protein] synthase III